MLPFQGVCFSNNTFAPGRCPGLKYLGPSGRNRLSRSLDDNDGSVVVGWGVLCVFVDGGVNALGNFFSAFVAVRFKNLNDAIIAELLFVLIHRFINPVVNTFRY